MTFTPDSQASIYIPNSGHQPVGLEGPPEPPPQSSVYGSLILSLPKAFPPTPPHPSPPIISSWILSFCRNCTNNHATGFGGLLYSHDLLFFHRAHRMTSTISFLQHYWDLFGATILTFLSPYLSAPLTKRTFCFQRH